MNDGSSQSGKIREAIIDGIFYPSDENELKEEIKSHLDSAPNKSSDAFAIISPHAGYRYAGKCLGAAYKAVAKRKLTRIVIIAPQHNNAEDLIILPDSGYFLTPLGSLQVDQEIIEEILTCSTGFVINDIPHLEEHCIETQLPFIKYMFPDVKIVPILFGKSSPKNIKILSNALQLTFSSLYEETLFVITANLTSYVKGAGSEKEAELLIKLIAESNAEGIKDAIANKQISSCGAGCIASLISIRNLKFESKVLLRDSSASVNNDPNKLVHYASIAIYTE